ncbi:MAG: sodium-extruding oxaloacetate decarboxylase subunit alpha [Pseudomonadota bacterium]
MHDSNPQRVQITDTILRDAHQSLLATRMRTEDMLPVCQRLDKIGFWSLEVWGGATFDACLRFLGEDPWQRLRQLRKALPNTRLQMLLRGQNLVGYRHYADDVVRSFVDKAAENGIDVFRIFDALNDNRNLRVAIETVKETGRHAQGTICYTTSPVHDIPRFVTQAQELEAMGCDSLCIKDMAGLLTPQATTDLIVALKQAITIPLHLHSHSTSGLASMCQLKAIENGCLHIDTAISALAGGTSHPPTESMVAALRDTPYDSGLDLEALQEIGFYFREVRQKYQRFESAYTGVDTRVQANQVPGGMISNLANQLREQGALTRMNEVLAEIPRVRADLGYPPLVTPSSQIVGTQAVLNVLGKSRYENTTREVKAYLGGHYGKAPGNINESLRKQVLGDEAVIENRPADQLPPEMPQAAEHAQEFAQSEEDQLIVALFNDVGLDFLKRREAGTLQPEALEEASEQDVITQSIGQEFTVELQDNLQAERYRIKITGGEIQADARHIQLEIDGEPEEVLISDGNIAATTTSGNRPVPQGPGDIVTTMPGLIVEVMVEEGSKVEKGSPLFVIEAMKMQSEIASPVTGIVDKIYINRDDHVEPGETLIAIKQ